jgi:hypothetical protein
MAGMVETTHFLYWDKNAMASFASKVSLLAISVVVVDTNSILFCMNIVELWSSP